MMFVDIIFLSTLGRLFDRHRPGFLWLTLDKTFFWSTSAKIIFWLTLAMFFLLALVEIIFLLASTGVCWPTSTMTNFFWPTLARDIFC